MRRRLQRLLGDARGNASIEFAFISLFFFAGIMVALDLGLYVQQKLKLGSAVEQAAIYAYVNKTGSDTSGVSGIITSVTGTAQPPTISCNGTSTCGDGKCSCVTSSGGFSIAATCGATCTASGTTANAISGNYLKIVATQIYRPVVVPARLLGRTSISQSAVVRLQ